MRTLLPLLLVLVPRFALAVSANAPFSCGATRTCTQGTGQGDHVGANHYALDFALAQGEAIVAARAGTVTALRTDGAGGCCSSGCNWRMNYVTVDHGDGTSGLYYHLDTHSAAVTIGQWVPAGGQLARSGFTGFTCGNNASYIGDGSVSDASASHLHFLIRNNSTGASLPIQFSDLGSPVTWGQYTSGNCAAPPPDACGGLDYAGECSGNTVRWCEAGGVRTKDCGPLGKACGYESDAIGYNCVEAPPPPEDPCNGLSAAGSCTGSTLDWCEGQAPRSYDCAWAGMACGWQSDAVGNNCVPLPPPPEDTCAAIGYGGRCSESTLEWCEGGAVQSYNCAWAGMGCGWQDDAVGFNCLSGALSAPQAIPTAKRPPALPRRSASGAAEEGSAAVLASSCSAAGQAPVLLALLLLLRRRCWDR